MTEQDPGERTEQPTPRRRQEARERGQVARSGDLTTAAGLLAGAAILKYGGEGLTVGLAGILRKSLAAAPSKTLDVPWLMSWLSETSVPLMQSLLPMLALSLVAAVAVNVAQVGLLLTSHPIAPDAGRLDPRAGLRRLLSWDGTAALVACLLKLGVIGAVAGAFVMGQIPRFLGSSTLDTPAFCRQLGGSLTGLGLRLAIGLVVLAAADYGFRLWRFEQSLRMTKQEVLDELRQTEGDSKLRQRRRELHRRMAQGG